MCCGGASKKTPPLPPTSTSSHTPSYLNPHLLPHPLPSQPPSPPTPPPISTPTSSHLNPPPLPSKPHLLQWLTCMQYKQETTSRTVSQVKRGSSRQYLHQMWCHSSWYQEPPQLCHILGCRPAHTSSLGWGETRVMTQCLECSYSYPRCNNNNNNNNNNNITCIF